jgi:hypothetical protein
MGRGKGCVEIGSHASPEELLASCTSHSVHLFGAYTNRDGLLRKAAFFACWAVFWFHSIRVYAEPSSWAPQPGQFGALESQRALMTAEASALCTAPTGRKVAEYLHRRCYWAIRALSQYAGYAGTTVG